ncbi:VCBS domain-containing protein [Vibrio crassostreae]|uniref:VCBS domain-containing protein n=1 Tax=Vibrio crassostreae TaxID=246167 RepID=UPI001BD27D3E|nr:VCBS domain-containing protein [Vibrio crassostreae]
MANKKNVEANKKNTEIKNKKSNELEQKKPTKKKKLRLHSHLKVNIPLFQSLMMILPSLAKHTAAEDVDNSGDNADQVAANNVTAKDSSDHHGKMDSSAVTHQEAQTSDSDVNSTLSASHAPHGSSSHLVPSHHLSTLSHPQVHYIPSVSMPTISSGSNGQPTHSNAPTTTALPVTFMPEVIKGTYGELHVDANGQYTFVLNPKSPQYILLNQHQQGTDHFLLHLSNGSSVIVQVPVTGKQDTPSISGDLTGVVTEDHNIDSQGLLHANGKIDVIDPDKNESSVAPEVISGKYGSLTIDADGHWQYQVNNSLSNVQALTAATSLHESFTIHTKDGTPQTIDMTIGGNDDNAVITGVDAGVVTEESHLQTSGTLTVTDVDTGEAQFSNTDVVGTLGTLHLKDNGAWTYDLDNTNPKVQALGQGATATDTMTVQSADGTPHKVTITVNGTNDKAVIAGTDSGAVTEESQLQTSGTLTVTDVDTGEVHFSNTDVAGNLGTLHLTDSGAWTYVLDNTDPTVQALGKGSTATDTITVHSADGTPHQVTITVNGTNDKAVIAGTDSGVVTEESQLTTSGTLTVTDIDTGEAHFSNTDVVGTLGTLHLKDNGTWTYDLDNTNPKVQALGHGSNATDTITVQSADGTTHQVSITVNGTNDKAVIAGTDSGAVTEESQLQTSGTLTLTDVDTGEAHFSNTDIKGSLGTLHLTDSGAWTYDLDNSNPAVQALAKGQHAKDIITVHSTDGTPHQVAITVNGANDAAQITGTTTGAVTEDRIYGMQWLVVNSHMNVTDTDAGEAHFDPVLHAQNNAGIGYTSTLGASVVVAPDGDWHYQLDNNIQQVQSLGQGQSYIDKVTVHTADGTTQELQITITGTNDAPTVTGSRVLPAGTEDQTLRITQTQLLAGATDIDKNDSGTLHVDAVTADHGTVTHNADGSFTFHPDQDYNGQVKFTYDIKDAHGGSVQATASSTLAAAGDAATISGVDTGDVHEGHTFTAPDGSMTGGYVDDRSPDHQHGNIGKLWNDEIHTDGHLSIVDADAGESYAQTGTYYGTHGRVILQTNGDWTYYASIGQGATGRAIDHLGTGESLVDTVTVKSADGTTHDIVVTIHGDNDRPYCSGEVQLNSGKEDLAQTITASELLANTVDVDTNDIGKLTITNLHADHGSILDNQDGTFTFTPTKDYNGQVHFTYDVQDAHGGVTHTGANTILAAVNDTAVFKGAITGSVTEDLNAHAAVEGGNFAYKLESRGTLDAIDPDSGESGFDFKTIATVSLHPEYAPYTSSLGGLLGIDRVGNWNYYIDNRKPEIQHLGAGETLTDTVTVHSKDGTPQVITITINGTNDQPVVSREVTLNSGTEDTALTFTAHELLANATDIDGNDAGQLTVDNLQVDHGSVVDNKDGTYTFTPEKDYNGDVHFTYDVKDAHGGVTHTGASTTLAAVDDKTIISGVDHGVATEDVATVVYTNPHIMDAVDWQALQITDVDSPNTQVTVEFAGKQYTWNIGSDLDITTPYGRFQFHTIASGPHQGEHSWSYIGDNNNVHVQELKHGESFTESIKLIATDGTEFPITVKVNGTEDGVVIDSKSELGHVVENAQTGASVSGNVVAHDVDLHDTVSWTQTPTAGISGQYGTFHLSADGQWHYDVDQSKATKLGDGTEYWEHFTVEAVSTDGSHVSKSVSVVVHGDNDLPTVSGEVTLPSGKEDTSIHITQAELIANATDVDTNDRGWLHVENLTADHGSLVSNSDGSFTFNPDPNYNGTVHFTYDVADRHGGIAHTGASTTLAAVNDAAVITGTGGHLLEEDNLYYGYTIKTNGQFHVVDPDGPSQSKFPDGLHHHTGSLGGTLQLYGNGNYFYHIENSAVNHLAKEQEARETFTIHSVDGTPHQVEFVIEGTNDAPFVHGDVTLSPGTEDTTVTLHASDLLAQAGDYDDGETAQLSVHNLSADHGTVTDNKDGTYTFKPDANYNGTVHFTYYVQDPQGATVATSASMALASVADTPVLSVDITDTSDNTLNASESGAAAISGSLDPSVASTLDRIEITDGTTTVTVDKANIAVATDGTYKTTADLTSLKDGALTVAAHATSHDGTTATATDTIIKDTQVSVPTITFENAGADNLYSKAEIARGQANTITATVTPPGDAKIGEHLVVNGRDHILDAHTLQHGIQIEVHPGSNVQATMTDEHGNTAGSQGFAASAIPEPIIVRPPSGSHQVSGTLGVPPLLPSLTPVPTAQSGWRIHLPNGQYVTSHHGQYGTLTIDPQTGHLHYQEQAQVHTGPHGSASGIGQHEDKFEVALQGTNQDEVVAHVNIQILSHGPGHSGKLTVGTEVVDMTITPVVHTSHPAPPPPPPEPNDDPDIALQADFTVMQSDDTYLDLTQHAHQEPDQKTSHHGAAAYLDALGIKPDATSTTVHDQPADMDIVLSQVDQPDAATHDQVHLDMSDALEHHDAANNHNQDEEHHHHNDVDGLPDIDPNS